MNMKHFIEQLNLEGQRRAPGVDERDVLATECFAIDAHRQPIPCCEEHGSRQNLRYRRVDVVEQRLARRERIVDLLYPPAVAVWRRHAGGQDALGRHAERCCEHGQRAAVGDADCGGHAVGRAGEGDR